MPSVEGGEKLTYHYQFKDTEFMGARDKELVIKDWGRFLKALLDDDGETVIDGYDNEMPKPFKAFTKRLYEHLYLHCNFIAHYDRWGFYQTYFEEGDDTTLFLSQFDKRNAEACGVPRSVEYGGTWWISGDYEDLNRAMIEEATPFIPKIMAKANAKQRAADVAQARALLKKHGIGKLDEVEG